MPRPRRFTIFDAMIFVAATAFGLTMARCINPEDRFGKPLTMWILRDLPSCVAFAWGFALLLIRLQDPRPRWRQLNRQPGFVASAITMGSTLVGMVISTGSLLIDGRPPTIVGIHTPGWYWGNATVWNSVAIVGAWLALALSHRWKSEPSWIDRMGRGLGLYWMISLPVRIFFFILQYAFPAYF